jgi:hypothetical protein
MDFFPEEINISIKNKERQAVPNIAIFIRFFATRKNDYVLLPSLSDQKGNIKITKDWIKREIKKAVDLFVMDYASSLDTCLPKFELKVLSEKEVNRAIKAMHLFKAALGTRQEDIDGLSKAGNSRYHNGPKMVNFSGEKIINIEISLNRT